MKQEKLTAKIALLIAEFFYCGKFPYAPGTMGTLGALIIWVPALYYSWPLWLMVILLIALFFIGLWASTYGIKHYQKQDPKQVVIDEVVGVGIPFLIINPHWYSVLIAFLVFRFFDIVKPWPIKIIEKKIPDEWGIMFDDVVAGIFSLVFIYLAKLLYFNL